MPETILREGKPRIWVTWLAKLLAGESQCLWATWYKARHVRYPKVPQDKTNLANWDREHTAQVDRRRGDLALAGYTVMTERENEFELVGKTAIVAGKPDLIATKRATGTNDSARLIVDEKTGKPRGSDRWQVLLYCYADQRGGHIPAASGLVGYSRDHHTLAVTGPLPDEVITIASMVQAVASPIPPSWTPSRTECGFCDIAECPKRSEKQAEQSVQTVDF